MAETLRDQVSKWREDLGIIRDHVFIGEEEMLESAVDDIDAMLGQMVAALAASPAAEPGVEPAIAAAVAAFGPLVDNAGGYDRSNLRVLIMDAPISETEKNRYREMEEVARKAWRALGRLVPQTPASGKL